MAETRKLHPRDAAAFRSGVETALDTVRDSFARRPGETWTSEEVIAIIQRSLDCATAVMGEMT